MAIIIHAYSKNKDGGKKLSANFKVREFACSDGSDPVFISPDLVEVLQKMVQVQYVAILWMKKQKLMKPVTRLNQELLQR